MSMQVMVAPMYLVLGHQVHLAFGAMPWLVLPYLRVHGAGIDNSRWNLCACSEAVVMRVMIHIHALL